jgi:purine-binding chemotaxis protein CheW
LRGKIIPVADLRIRFGLEAVDHGARTCIIVVRARGAEFGLVVDRVVEVARIEEQDIEPPPLFGADIHTDFLRGIARHGSRVRLLLDVEQTLTPVENVALAAAAQA